MRDIARGSLAVLLLLAAWQARALPVAQSFEATRFVEAEAEATAPAADPQPLMQLVQLARSVAVADAAADELLLSPDARQPAIGSLSHPLHVAASGRWGRTELPGGLPPVVDRRVALLSRP